MERFGLAKAAEYKHMEEQKVEVKPPWLKEENRKYADFMSEWKDMKLHIRSLFPEAVIKKVEPDKVFFLPEKKSEVLHVCRKENNAYKVEVKKMTCREKLEIEYPDCVGSGYIAGCAGCPHHYGYVEPLEGCNGNKSLNKNCHDCWNRVEGHENR